MKILRDEDADLRHLRGRMAGIIGYGNQGRAQALNLRDSGVSIVIGALPDESASEAERDGFDVVSIEEACRKADILALLIPDEVQTRVYRESVAPALGTGKALVFAHGYNIHFGLIVPPPEVDVILVAPRMIGIHVRRSFEEGRGAPAYIAVSRDASGTARDVALAWAKGIGAARAGVLETTFAQETELDLFTEQATWPIIVRDLLLSYEVLVEAGFPGEMVALELYGSGEASEVFHQMARRGLFRQMRLHSQTSQYGTLSRAPKMLPEEARERFRQALAEIRSGAFAREWTAEQEKGYPEFESLRKNASEHPLNEAEALALEIMKRTGIE
jgi:ketol-acid reductoisomerase